MERPAPSTLRRTTGVNTKILVALELGIPLVVLTRTATHDDMGTPEQLAQGLFGLTSGEWIAGEMAISLLFERVRSRDKLESALGSAKGLEREAASIVTRAAGLLGSVRTLSRSKETMELQGALAKQLAGHGAAAGVRAHHEEIARRIAGMEKYGMY